ncbi:MAG: NAD(P)-dependent oxidoreductase, partial [Nocardioides sp.]|nr:NAD(P)-dependent oxidoreductase [Nocardioides sp.]
MSSTTPTVGVIGLGAMGRPAAELLAAAGVETHAYDTDSAVLDAVVDKGVKAADSLAALAAASSVILVFVPTDDDVVAVCSPKGGILAGAAEGSTILICSSARPDTCRKVAELAAPHGVDVLDAALTGGVRAAEAGTINLLVGGDEAVLDKVRPTLEPWCGTVHLLGPLGAGQVGKTVNNLCHWGQLSVIVEALRLGRALGVEPTLLREALMDAPPASRTLKEMQLMRLTWHHKDLANAMVMAESVGYELPVATTVREAMHHISVADIADLYTA